MPLAVDGHLGLDDFVPRNQHPDMNYAFVLIREIRTELRSRTREWRGHLIAFIVQSAIVFLILYKVPVLGNVNQESKLAVAAAAAIVVSGVLNLIWAVITVPGKIHREIMSEFKKQHFHLQNVINTERYALLLANIFAEGEKTYHTLLEPYEYKIQMDAWVEKVRTILKDQVSIAELFKFNDVRYNNMWFTLRNNATSDWETATLEDRQRYSGHLQALKHMIEFSERKLIVDVDSIGVSLANGQNIIARY